MKKFHAFILILLLAVVAGCSSSNSDAPVVGGPGTGSGGNNVHPTTWISDHGVQASSDLRGCQSCHGFDFKGSGQAVSCYTCHDSGPPFTGHPASWNGNPKTGHQLNFSGDPSLPGYTSWNSCATAACHGTDLQGTGTSGAPSCMNNTASCHSTSTNSGWPNAPHSGYTPPSNGAHGLAAKGETDPTLSMGNYCAICHADASQPLATRFNGGFVAANYSGVGNCSACHSAATAHPGNWASTRASNSVFHNDGNISANPNIKSDSCALCHTTTANTPSSPFTGAPTCFNADFNGLTCHAGGPVGAPHVVPFTDPNLHGPAAKADLAYCQTCHGDNGTAGGLGVPGSNPRFNVPKGSMANGCEDCHATGSAHATGTDRWTFNKDSAYPTRRTHFAAGNINTGCVLCHDATSNTNDDTGSAPACTTCHTSLTASGPAAAFDCTVCHGQPPTGGTDLTGGTVVDHAAGTDVTTISNHESCSICHGVSESSGTLVVKNSNYTLFSGTGAGGNHLDGKIEVNTDVGYQDSSAPAAQQFGCNLACHPNDTNHQMPNGSGLTTNFGSYTAGTVSCTDCHGYPPDGTDAQSAPGVAAGKGVDHIRMSGSTNILLANHGDCQTCHGTRESASSPGTHAPTGDYTVSSNHYNGTINMNQQTTYNENTWACDNAVCHDNQAPHILSDSGLTVQFGNYGAGSCSSCHGYPPDATSNEPAGVTRVDHTAFADSGAKLLSNHIQCQGCHGTKETTSGSSTHDPAGAYDPTVNHRNNKIEMNTDTQYSSTTNGCAQACHANAAPYVLPNGSGLQVNLINTGFSGTCDSCHGYPPIANTLGGPNGLDNSVGTGSTTSGKHAKHTGSGVGELGYGCSICHTGYNMPNGGQVDIGFNVQLGATTDTTGTYDGRTGGGGYNASNTGTTVTTGGALTCSAIYCHGTSTPKWLDTESPMACGSCHGDTNGMPSTTPGDGDLSGNVTGKKVGKHVNHVVNRSFACSVCHNGAGDGTTKHVDGTNDVVFDTTQAGSSAAYNAGSSTCSNLSCHGDAVWDTATTGGCDFCHGYPPNSTSKHAIGFTAVNHSSGVFTNHDDCSYCHGVKDNGSGSQVAMSNATLGGSYLYVTSGASSDHQDGSITMNGPSGTGAGYNSGNGGCDNGVCHINDSLHRLNVGQSGTGNNLQGRDFGPGKCSSCHDTGVNGAPVVTGSSTHVITTVNGTYNDCTDCHSGHAGSGGGVDIPLPPTSWTSATGETHVNGNMRTALGIDYNGHGGIHLGGSGTVAAISSITSSEAEICWACHDLAANNIGELQGGAGGGQYTFGRLASAKTGGSHVSNWTTTSAWRQDDYDTRLNRPIASVHTAYLGDGTSGSDVAGHSSSVSDNITSGKVHRGGNATTQVGDATFGTVNLNGSSNAVVLEAASYIRCSYCHDVHSLNKAPGDTGSAAPFLRGSWMSDPYLPDAPPKPSQVWTGDNAHAFGSKQAGKGGMPRNEAAATGQGGYFIDQNSSNPSDGESVSTAAGLCAICHGSNVNSMDYYTGSKLWVGTNGHSNSTVGGSGSNATDLFDARRGRTSYLMALQDKIGNDIKSNTPPWGEQDAKKDRADNSNWYGTYANWYAANKIGDRKGGTDSKAHNFVCSKCHSPHATGLPALLITNCLDTELGGWANPNSSSGRVKYDQPQSNNCHRKSTNITADDQNDGWNTLAPKQ